MWFARRPLASLTASCVWNARNHSVLTSFCFFFLIHFSWVPTATLSCSVRVAVGFNSRCVTLGGKKKSTTRSSRPHASSPLGNGGGGDVVRPVAYPAPHFNESLTVPVHRSIYMFAICNTNYTSPPPPPTEYTTSFTFFPTFTGKFVALKLAFVLSLFPSSLSPSCFTFGETFFWRTRPHFVETGLDWRAEQTNRRCGSASVGIGWSFSRSVLLP